MSIEIPRPDFKSYDLLIFSQQRQEAAREFKFLFNRVISDPQATHIVRTSDDSFLICTVPFCEDEKKRLKAKQDIDFGKTIEPQITFELSVQEPDGDMSLAITEADLLTFDLEHDGYSQMILDYFRIQYTLNS